MLPIRRREVSVRLSKNSSTSVTLRYEILINIQIQKIKGLEKSSARYITQESMFSCVLSLPSIISECWIKVVEKCDTCLTLDTILELCPDIDFKVMQAIM